MDGIISEKLYTTEQVAELLGISKRSVWRLLNSGDLKGRHLGRRWYVLGADLLVAGTQDAPKPSAKLEPEPDKRVIGRKREPVKKVDGWRPLGHELKANGGKF